MRACVRVRARVSAQDVERWEEVFISSTSRWVLPVAKVPARPGPARPGPDRTGSAQPEAGSAH